MGSSTTSQTTRQKRPAPADAPAPAVRPRTILLVLVLFVLAFTALRVLAYTQQSATWDEPMHLTAGYAALAHGDFRVDPSHPPFIRAWAALPLLAAPPAAPDLGEIDRTPVRDWFSRGYDFARRFLYSHNDADRLLYPARFMMTLWGCVLGILLFAWAYEWLGFAWAATLLAFYAVEPNLTAHSALVTTDFGVTCFIFGAVYFLWRTSRRFTPANVLAVAVFVSLAAVTKFSSVLLGPIVVALLAAAIWSRSEISLRRAGVVLAVVALATVMAVWAAYGFRYLPSPSSGWAIAAGDISNRDNVPLLAAVVGFIDEYRLLPNAYSQGFLFSQASVRELPAFMAGTVRTGGWWYYLPFAFLLKTPLALVLFFGAGLLAFVARRHVGLRELFVLIPLTVCLVAGMASGINLGVRHILPVYPFALLIAAAAARELLARRQQATRVLVVAAGVFWVAEFAVAYPHPLTFFNSLAGGPRNGFRYLADSNLAWGGNLKLLKRWMDEKQVTEINLAYFGSADPSYYGINATYLPGSPTHLQDQYARPRLPGYVAISGTVLSGVYLPAWWQLFYGGFHDREPVAVIGNTMRVYWVDTWPEAPQRNAANPEALEVLAEGLLFGLGWPEHAALHFEEYLRRFPGDVTAWNGLAVAHTQMGRLAEAADGFTRVVELAPDDARARENLAAVRQQIVQLSSGRREGPGPPHGRPFP